MRRCLRSATHNTQASTDLAEPSCTAPGDGGGGRKEILTFRIDTLRVRPLSLVGLMLSAFFDRFLVFLGGLVPRPVVEELELEVLVLKRERPRTMAGEGLGGSPRRGGRAENYAEAPMSRLARWTPRASAVVGRRRGARRLPAPVARGE